MSNVPVCMKVNVFVKESGSDFSSHTKWNDVEYKPTETVFNQ
jgi:hypothetical protein